MRKHLVLSRKKLVLILVIGVLLAASACSPKPQQQAVSQQTTSSSVQVKFGVSPFQDTLLPIVGKEKGWYQEEGLDVDFKILGWTEVMEALSAGQIDVAINNISSVIATHQRNPNIVYWYGFNPFDNGFALMIRPDGKLKTLVQVQQEVKDPELAVKQTAAQLKGKTVVTTGKTDMEQGVAAAARRGGLDFRTDIHIIDMNPDEGLAAFLRGEGDAYIGGIPQRTRAGKEGMVEMLTGAELGPPPINGIVTTRTYAENNQDTLIKILHVWFKTVNLIDTNMEDGASAIIQKLNSSSGAQFTLEDFRKFWNNYEHFPRTPREVQDLILAPTGRNYWKARWDDCNSYFLMIGTITKPVEIESAFLMEGAQKAYVARYGSE